MDPSTVIPRRFLGQSKRSAGLQAAKASKYLFNPRKGGKRSQENKVAKGPVKVCCNVRRMRGGLAQNGVETPRRTPPLGRAVYAAGCRTGEASCGAASRSGGTGEGPNLQPTGGGSLSQGYERG